MASKLAALRLVRVLILSLAAGLVLTACSSASSSEQSNSRYISGDGSVVVVPEADRVIAPEITGETLDGKPFNLADYKGKVVPLNIWASWCAPCRAEAPALEQLSRELGPKGVQFVGINTRDTKPAAQAFVKRFDLTYPDVWDPDGKIQLQFRGTLPPQAIPSTLIVDRQGRVAARILGKVDRTQMRELLTELLAEPGPSA
ncbi:MAG: TlpA disulfide reductase family protein [Candidatus Nanopelagicales bacterium]